MAAQEATASRSYVLPEPSPEKRRALQLELEIIELCGHLSAAEHRFLQLIAEFDRDKLWEWFGVASCAQWLTWQCGLGEVAAREHVRVARALEKLPKISAVFSRGEISYSKVRAMTRVATSKIEDTLVTVALYGTAAHVERFVRQYRRFERLEEAAQAAGRHRQRHVHFTYDEDGSLIIYAKLPPEIGEVVKKAIEAAVEELYQDGMRDRRAEAESSEGDRNESPVETRSKVSAETFPPSPPSEPSASLKSPSPGWGTRAALGTSAVEEMEGESWSDSLARRRADALRLVAERFLSGGLKRASSAADRYQVFVHIDQALLARPAGATSTDRTAGGTEPTLADYLPSVGRCELEDGQVLAIETARRLACDASLVGIVEDENGEPLNVGRKTRSISPALNRALRSRDGGCRFPGCDRRLFVEGHHVEHWVNGGETKPSNLITLCGFHHGLVHEGGFGLKGTDDGAFVFARPDGSIVEQNGRARAMLQKACRMHESGWSIGTHRRSAPDSVARRGRSDIDAAADAEQSYTDEESEQALELLASNRERGLDIDATTGRCRWTGERLDYHLAVGYMAACRDVARTQARARAEAEAEAEAEADLPLRG